MTIQLYLKDGDNETSICTFREMHSNPFKLGDIISLSVKQLREIHLKEIKKEFLNSFYIQNEKIKEQFNLRDVKIIKEHKFITIEALMKDSITIEYMCEFIPLD